MSFCANDNVQNESCQSAACSKEKDKDIGERATTAMAKMECSEQKSRVMKKRN
jgi:hypothetical protein